MNQPSTASGGSCREDDGARADGRRGHVLLLVAVCLGLFLLRAESLPLADPEESRCALIVRDMIRQGHWWVPHLAGQPYFDKPAPFFWLAALGVKLTGRAELGGRGVSALAALGAVLVTYAFTRRLFASGPAGLTAGLVLATSGEFLFMARWYRMDMPFVAAMWAALWWFWRFEDRRVRGQSFRRSALWLGFYLFSAVATLFKGPVGLGLPVLVVLAYFLLARQYRRVGELVSPVGVGAFLLLAAPWYVVASISQPGFAREFFLRQNLQRFVGGGELGHHWLGILSVPIVLVGLLPWTIYLPGAIVRYFPRRWRERSREPAWLFLWLSALVPSAVVSLSHTYLASYVLPVFPPLAVLLGGLVATWVTSHRPDRIMRVGARSLIVAVGALPVVLLGAELWLKTADGWLAVPFAVSALAVVSMILSLGRAKRGQFVGWAICGIVGFFVHLIVHTAPVGYGRMSARAFALQTAPLRTQPGTVCLWSHPALSFLFYCGADDVRDFQDSVEGDLHVLQDWLNSDRRVYCLVASPRRLRELQAGCARPLRVLAHQDRYWLVTNLDDSHP